MSNGDYKIMRLILMFDLPVETKEQRREYSKFHKQLIKNGFMMLQYSVYTRYCNNDTSATKFIDRVKLFKPDDGNIRIIKVTENQFNNMIMLSGNKNKREIIESEDNLLIID